MLIKAGEIQDTARARGEKIMTIKVKVGGLVFRRMGQDYVIQDLAKHMRYHVGDEIDNDEEEDESDEEEIDDDDDEEEGEEESGEDEDNNDVEDDDEDEEDGDYVSMEVDGSDGRGKGKMKKKWTKAEQMEHNERVENSLRELTLHSARNDDAHRAHWWKHEHFHHQFWKYSEEVRDFHGCIN